MNPVILKIFNFLDTILFERYAEENLKREFKYPLYVAEFIYEFRASKYQNSQQCLDKKACDPLGGQSVWSRLNPNQETNRKLILSLSTSDSSAAFHEGALGARANQASVIANLAAAEVLKRTVQDSLLQKEIQFYFFTGEAWGYIGSKRFIKDVKNFTCQDPMNDGYACNKPFKFSTAFKNVSLSNIDNIIELGQIGGDQLYTHIENQFAGNNTLDLLKTVKSVSERLNIFINQSSIGILPPGSLHSFLLNDQSISSVMINDFDQSFTNKYYHGQFDNIRNINFDKLCQASSLLASSLYDLSKNPDSPVLNIQSNCTLIKELANCLLENYNCSLMLGYGLPETQESITKYTGIFRWMLSITRYQSFIYHFMSSLTTQSRSEQSCTIQSQLNDCNIGENCVSNKCVKSTTYFHDAYSTALEFNYDNYKWDVIENQNESLFTETIWDKRGCRVYIVDSTASEILTVSFGVILTLLFALVFISHPLYLRFRYWNLIPQTPRNVNN